MFDLVERYKRLTTTIDDYCWRDTEQVNKESGDAGDFLNAVYEEVGLRVVDDVLGGLEHALACDIGTDNDDLPARRHAADHYRRPGGRPSSAVTRGTRSTRR